MPPSEKIAGKTPCFICGNSGWDLYPFGRQYPEYSYARCRSCSFLQLTPVPDSETLAECYRELWSGKENQAYGEQFIRHGIWPEDALRRWLGPIFADMNRFLGTGKTRPRLVEIGVGSGNVLAAAKLYGWDACGIDVSEDIAKKLKEIYGFEMVTGDFCSTPPEKLGKADAVHMSHSFEHMEDPNLALARIRQVLNPRGLFYCTVPAIDENLFRWTSGPWRFFYNLSGGWKGLYPFFWCFNKIVHISCFSSRSLKRLLEKNGFEVRWIRYDLPELKVDWKGSWLRHLRTLAMIPLFLLTQSGWKVTVLAQSRD